MCFLTDVLVIVNGSVNTLFLEQYCTHNLGMVFFSLKEINKKKSSDDEDKLKSYFTFFSQTLNKLIHFFNFLSFYLGAFPKRTGVLCKMSL